MRKVLIVHPTAQLFNIPCVVQLAESIASDTKHEVHFARITSSNNANAEGDLSSRIVSHYYSVKMSKRKESVIHWLIGYSLFAYRVARATKTDIFVGMGSKGLAVAWFLSWRTSKPFLYYNLEFYTSDEWPVRSLVWNSIERRLLKRCRLLVIHDEHRCRIYKTLMHYKEVRCALFPNAPISTDIDDRDINYIRSVFNIRPEKKYLIYAGGLYPRVGLDKLCNCLDQLPKEWCLVLQSHDGVDKIVRTPRLLRLMSSSRLIINREPLSPSKYAALLSMCHIGIAFYRNNDTNMRNVGLSSGKIGAYWKYGLPVIVNDIPFYNELFRIEKGGAIYDNFDNIAPALLKVVNDYDAHRKRAFLYYERYFTLDRYTRVINDLIGELVGAC